MDSELNIAAPDDDSLRLRFRTRMLPARDYLLLGLGKRKVKLPFDEVTTSLLFELRAGTSRSLLRARMEGRVGASGADEAIRWFDELRAAGFLESAASASGLGPREEARFERLIRFFAEHETAERSREEMFRSLRRANVGLIGTGGTGSWVIYHLMCFGVGKLTLFDADVVEMSNLTRTITFTEEDVGRRKVTSSVRAIERFLPDTEVVCHDLFIEGIEQLLPLVRGLDLVIGACDKPAWLIKGWIAGACKLAGVPVLQINGSDVGPFTIPGVDSSCTMCEWARHVEKNPAFPQMLRALRRLPDQNPGGISPHPAMASSVIAGDVLRFLALGVAPRMLNQVWQLNPDLSSQYRPAPRHAECPVCSGDPVRAMAELGRTVSA